MDFWRAIASNIVIGYNNEFLTGWTSSKVIHIFHPKAETRTDASNSLYFYSFINWRFLFESSTHCSLRNKTFINEHKNDFFFFLYFSTTSAEGIKSIVFFIYPFRTIIYLQNTKRCSIYNVFSHSRYLKCRDFFSILLCSFPTMLMLIFYLYRTLEQWRHCTPYHKLKGLNLPNLWSLLCRWSTFCQPKPAKKVKMKISLCEII